MWGKKLNPAALSGPSWGRIKRGSNQKSGCRTNLQKRILLIYV